MKRIFTFLFLFMMITTAFGQMERFFTFETGADTGWTVFANTAAGIEDIWVVENPAKDAVNSSDSCLKFHVRPGADRWVGLYTDYDVLTEFTEDAKTLAMMVYKEVISPVGLKVERSLNGGSDLTVKVPNTLTYEWELLTFDFTPAVGFFYERFTIFPDFPDDARDPSDSTDVWMDNIGVPEETNTTVKEFAETKMWLYPTPATNRMAVQCDNMTGIIVSDVTGRIVKSMQFGLTNSKVIPTADLISGIYFLTAETTKGRVTMRFLKE
jgi:hypothetical protein